MGVSFGDIIEISTNKGLAYAIYTHRHSDPPKFGALIHVFEGIYASRPEEFEKLVSQPIMFATFFPLAAAVQRDLVRVVGHVDVPKHLKSFPIFRGGNADPKTKKVSVWWLWDGKKSWRVGDITAEQRKLPIKNIVNDTALKQMIEEGWRPELDKR